MRLPWRRGRAGEAVLLLCFALNEDFLSHQLFPEARRLRVGPESRAGDLVAAIPPACRLAVQCLNLTEPRRLLPLDSPLRQALARRGIRLLNGGLESHAKRDLHALLRSLGLPCSAAPPAGPPEELLIVKANQNSGALVERGLAPAERGRLGLDAVPDHVPHYATYPVLPRHAVPAAWFADPFLAVERFLRGFPSASYRYFVAGRHVMIHVRASEARVIRGDNSTLTHRAALVRRGAGWAGELPPDAHLPQVLEVGWQVARAAGLELGALDVVVDETGQAHVLDINSTPYLQPGVDFGAELLPHLRAGIQFQS